MTNLNFLTKTLILNQSVIPIKTQSHPNKQEYWGSKESADSSSGACMMANKNASFLSGAGESSYVVGVVKCNYNW